MNLDLDRIFGGGRVPDWLRTFAADPDLALHNLVLGRAELDHLTVVDPVDLLLGWLRALGNRTDFRAQVDQSLSSWIVRNWGLIELPGGADSATLTSAAWVRVGEVLAAVPTLTAAGDALAQRVLADRRYLNSLGEGRSRDPQAAAWRALATHQRDRSLLPTWWQLCELPPDEPWYRGHCGIVGLRGLPSESAARAGGFPKEVAEGLNRFGLALCRLQDEGWLSPDLAAEEFQDALRLCLSAYPFPDRWISFWRHVLRRDYRRGDLGAWIRPLLPRVADDPPGKGSNKPNWVSYDPAWFDRAKSITERLRQGGAPAIAEAERLLAAQRGYFERSGDSYGVVRSASAFSAAVRQSQPAQALLWARLAKEVEPWNSYGWTNEGQSLLAMNDRPGALEVYRETKARFPNDVFARNGLAEVLKAQNRFADAEVEYRETKARFPDNVVARNGLAGVLKAQHRFADAEAEYRETKARFPNNVVARTGLAEVLRAQHRFADAEVEYRETKARFPDNIFACNGLAEVLKAQGQLADAEAEYREAKARFPDNVVACNGLAEVLKAQGQIADAEAEYLEAKARFPDNVVARTGLAEVLKAQGQFADAEVEYRETKARFPDNVVARNGLAEVLKAQDRFAEAEAEYRETQALFPNDVFARNGLAEVLKAQDQFADAEAEYRDLKTAYPESLAPRNNLIFVLKAQKRWEEVLTEYREAIDLSPENLHLHMGLGAALVQANRLAEAEAHYRQAQERFPDEPFAYTKLADILVAEARFSEAEHAYREARRRASDSFAVWVGLVRALNLQGRTEEAEAEYRAMEERFPDKCVPRGNSDEIPDSLPEHTDNGVIVDEGEIAPPETELPGTFPASVAVDSPADVKAPAKTSPVPGEEPWLNRREIDIVAGDAFLIRGWARAAGTYDPDAAPGRFRERAAVLLHQLLPSVDTDSVAAGESALLELDDGALAEGLALLRRAVQRFPGSARVRYALARAEREATQGDPITSWRRLLRMDPHYEPIVYLGAGRAWLGRMAQDGAKAEEQAREMFGRLGYWIDKRIEPLPNCDPHDPHAEPRTSYRARRIGDFSGWWGIEAQAELFGMRPVAGWDDLDDLGPIRERVLTSSASLDRLEEDWVRRYARA